LGGRLFFTRDEVVLALPGISNPTATTVAGPDVEADVVHLRFDGANSVEPTGVEQLPGVANYYPGNDPTKWRTNIPTYAGVVYRQLYPGIDLRYEGTAGSLKGTYTIALDAAGNIYIAGQTQSKDFPIRNAVQPNCALNGDHCEQDAFVAKIKADGSELVYSTYLGGTWNDYASGIAVDSSGNAYVVGSTYSLGFPTLDAIQPELSQGLCGNINVWPYKDRECYDAFVANLRPAGALVYSTYLGGSNDDFGNAIAVDASGVAHIVGHISSTNFPTVQPLQSTKTSTGGQSDVFIARIRGGSARSPTPTPVVSPTPGPAPGPFRLYLPAVR
jgi:hypothetical protein